MDNFKITKTILENINEQNDRINECVDIVNGYTTDEETRVNQEIQRQQNELIRQEQYNNNENRFNLINEQLDNKAKQLNNITIDVTNPPNNLSCCKIDGVTDDYIALNNIITYLKSKGGGTLLFPFTGQKMLLSNELFFDFSNITLDIRCDIKFIKTTKFNGFNFKAKNINEKIKNIKILGNGNIIDGNGQNIEGYNYSLNDNSYNTLSMYGVENIEIKNLKVANGLVCSCSLNFCKNFTVDNCEFYGAIHDNGFQTVGSPMGIDFTLTDFNTFTNGRIVNSRAYSNTDFGFTSYRSPFVIFENCISNNNGNNNTSYGKGGGYSAENGDGTNFLNWMVQFINCKSFDNIGYGYYIDMNGISIDKYSSALRTTKLNNDTLELTGNGVTVTGSTTNININGTFNSNGRHGIRYLSKAGDENAINGLYIDAICEDNTNYAFKGQGIEYANINGRFNRNGDIGLRIDNTQNYNFKKGTCILGVLECAYNNNIGVVLKGIGINILRDLTLISNCNSGNGITNLSADNSNMFIINNLTTLKGSLSNLTLGCVLNNTINVSKVMNINTDMNNPISDNSITKKGLALTINNASGSNVADIIPTINTIIARLKNARIIDN